MTLAHDWFDNSENTLIDEPIEPSEANEPMLPIDSTEPTLPIERTEPDDPIERNESLLATDHCSRGILMGSAYAATGSGSRARSDRTNRTTANFPDTSVRSDRTNRTTANFLDTSVRSDRTDRTPADFRRRGRMPGDGRRHHDGLPAPAAHGNRRD